MAITEVLVGRCIVVRGVIKVTGAVASGVAGGVRAIAGSTGDGDNSGSLGGHGESMTTDGSSKRRARTLRLANSTLENTDQEGRRQGKEGRKAAGALGSLQQTIEVPSRLAADNDDGEAASLHRLAAHRDERLAGERFENGVGRIPKKLCPDSSPGGAIEMDAVTPPPLSQLEVHAVLRRLSKDDKTKVMMSARTCVFADKTPYDYEDLFQEACVRLFDGRRAWPRNADPVRHFVGVMRSIASEWKRKPPIWVTETIDVDCQERNQNAMIDVAKLVGLFDDDAVAQKIVIAIMDGARGQELQSLCKLSKTEYESKRTKIRRRIEKCLSGGPVERR